MNLEWPRTEVLHPLSVHFPIVLLILASIAVFIQFLVKNKSSWQHLIDISLFSGTALIWLAIYTGDLADGIVSRTLCDPTVLKDHENFGFYTAYVFSAASLVLILTKTIAKGRKGLRILLLVLALSGVGLITYVGHLGASLVYDQAAGVSVPPEDCAGF